MAIWLISGALLGLLLFNFGMLAFAFFNKVNEMKLVNALLALAKEKNIERKDALLSDAALLSEPVSQETDESIAELLKAELAILQLGFSLYLHPNKNKLNQFVALCETYFNKANVSISNTVSDLIEPPTLLAEASPPDLLKPADTDEESTHVLAGSAGPRPENKAEGSFAFDHSVSSQKLGGANVFSDADTKHILNLENTLKATNQSLDNTNKTLNLIFREYAMMLNLDISNKLNFSYEEIEDILKNPKLKS